MTAKSSANKDTMENALRGRVSALAKAHELIRSAITAETELDSEATLGELIRTIMAPHVPEDEKRRLVTEGPVIVLGPSSATSLALVFHEWQRMPRNMGLCQNRRGGFQ